MMDSIVDTEREREMTQIDSRRFGGSPSGRQLLPTSIPHQGGGYGHWSTPETPTFSYLYEHEDHNHGKKSIMMKVKEKAKKWRQVLTKKRHGNDGSDDATPPWGVSLDETDVEDPEYHGAPMYESEMAQDACKCQTSDKHAACQLHCAEKKPALHQPITADKESEMKDANDLWQPPALNNLRAAKEKPISEARALPPRDDSSDSQQRDMPSLNAGDTTPLREKIAEMIAPAYVMISDARHVIASKIQESRPGCEMAARQVWCKSVAAKDSLMQKLQPKEEDRALCQVITEAVSPRSGAGDQNKEAGVVEKVKEVVSSLMAKEEPHVSSSPASTNPFSADDDDDHDDQKDIQAAHVG